MNATPSLPVRTRYRTLRLCSGGGGFEAIPISGGRIDIRSVRRRLESAGIPTTDARVMLIFALDAEVTISAAGRILIKTSDQELAQRTFERVLYVLFADS
ncbi:MAG: hypothetical protein WAK40_03570 [Thermoplasmata archaeon]